MPGFVDHYNHQAPMPLALKRLLPAVLPGDALSKLEVGLRLFAEDPVRHRFGSIIPDGWESCAQAAIDRT